MKLTCKQCWNIFLSDRSNKKYCSMKCYSVSKKWKQLVNGYYKHISKTK